MDRKHTAYYVLCQPSSNNCAAVVSYMASYFKQKGLYFTSSKDLCKGDIVFFQNSSGLSHVGICVDWYDSSFDTVEGNKDNQVKRCNYRYSQVGGYVAGFAHPRYCDDCTCADALEYALSQVGYTEGASNWNKYAAELDAVDYFAGCGKKQNLPWCAVFICAVMYNAYKDNPDPPTPPTPTKDEYTVKTNSGDALRLRAEANTSSEQVGYIPNGKTIKADEVVKGESIGGCEAWVKTSYNGAQGYASGKYLTPTPQIDPDPEPPTPTKRKFKVVTNSGDSLRLREKPTTDSTQVGYIPNGNIIEAEAIVDGESIGGCTDWALTENGTHYNGATSGYCSCKYLKEV